MKIAFSLGYLNRIIDSCLWLLKRTSSWGTSYKRVWSGSSRWFRVWSSGARRSCSWGRRTLPSCREGLGPAFLGRFRRYKWWAGWCHCLCRAAIRFFRRQAVRRVAGHLGFVLPVAVQIEETTLYPSYNLYNCRPFLLTGSPIWLLWIKWPRPTTYTTYPSSISDTNPRFINDSWNATLIALQI